jgi:hypothetical protein
VNVEAVGGKISIPVDAIEREQRERSRMRPPDARAVQLPPQSPADRAREPEPLVEIAHHHARAGQLVVEDVLAHQPPHLLGPLADLEAEVHVEEMERPVRHLEVQPDAAARLTVGLREIEDAAAPDGEPREDRVAVGQPVALPGRPHRHLDS